MVLVTEYVHGKPLFMYMRTENGFYDKLTAMAHVLRKLHEIPSRLTTSKMNFAHLHKVLDHLKLDRKNRLKYDRLLRDWWYSTLLDQPSGCMIHNDANPVNYVFDHNRVYVLDFESFWEHANPVHDLGTVAPEHKHYFAIHKSKIVSL